MEILDVKDLRNRAGQALRRGREPKKLIRAYAFIGLAVTAVVFLLNLWLDDQIGQTGGLSNLGNRAIFSTAQQVLPILSGFVLMCLDLGFLGGMLRITRGQYADHTDLKVGFRKFWPLLRLSLIQAVVYFAVTFLAIQLGSTLFLFTPWAEPLMEVLYPIYESGSLAISEEMLMELYSLMLPLFLVIGVLLLAMLLPVLYKMRLAYFCLLDDPRGRAMAAIRESGRMLKGRFRQMLKLDLSLWLYYAAGALTSLVLYLDVLLALLGIAVPVDGTVFAAVLYGAASLMQLAVNLFPRPGAEASYLLAYDRLRDKPQDNGVVLGNIFDM